MPTPTESPESEYRQALEDGRFELQECKDCGNHIFPPRVVCPACGSSALHWQPASGHGTVYACTVVQRRVEKGGPYNVVLIDLSEGVRMMSHVTGFGEKEVPIGLPVRACIDGDSGRLVFAQSEGGQS